MKSVTIEWRHLDVDGDTCDRCGDTGVEVRRAVEQLNDECAPAGYRFDLAETRLAADALADSNAILIDGQPLESLLPNGTAGSSECTSCAGLIAAESASCRTVEVDGDRFERVPAELIRDAACRLLDCCTPGCCG